MQVSDFSRLRPLVPADWATDPYAKTCERCETVVGRYGVLQDEQGWRHVTWWPHREWDGATGAFRCQEHTESVASSPSADASIPLILHFACGHRRWAHVADGPESPAAQEAWRAARASACDTCVLVETLARDLGASREP